MTKTIFIIGFILSFGLSMMMLFYRRKKWLNDNVKFKISLPLTIIGLIGFSLSKSSDFRFLFSSMLVPSIYLLIDKIFKKISIKYQGRDFYLYLRFSDDVDKDVSALDIIISFTFLAILMGLLAFGAVLFGKDDLYNKWIMN
jgi:hypothetical protein